MVMDNKTLVKLTRMFRENHKIIEYVVKNVHEEYFIETLEFIRFMLSKQAVDVNLILLKAQSTDTERIEESSPQSGDSENAATSEARRSKTLKKKRTKKGEANEGSDNKTSE
jgi:hypothetical protein